jgi:hypothetical protein
MGLGYRMTDGMAASPEQTFTGNGVPSQDDPGFRRRFGSLTPGG